MKKGSCTLIELKVLLAAILIGVSAFTVNTFNASNSKANSSLENPDKSSSTQNNESTNPVEINSNVVLDKAIESI